MAPLGMSLGGEIREGAVLGDRYRLIELIGSGGMARVYRALDMELQEELALKIFLQIVYDEDGEGLRRFRQEMKLSRKLIHPNIVRIYEFGAWRGARFITMELLKGVDLEAWVEKHGGLLPQDDVLRLMIQACAGLEAAHAAGVIHRDVKPSNFFIIDEGKRLKLMDFGVAKVQGTGQSLSGVDARIGTPRYMSPEQIQGGVPIGPPADLYGLGALMYEVLSGRRVFEEDELVPLLLSHLSEPPVPLRQHAPQVTAEIEGIVMRLLQKDPVRRFTDCGELRKVLLKAYVNIQSNG
jgi:serine/threonine-protein kinase